MSKRTEAAGLGAWGQRVEGRGDRGRAWPGDFLGSVGGSSPEEFRSSGQLGHRDVPGVPDGWERGCRRLHGAGGFSSGRTA